MGGEEIDSMANVDRPMQAPHVSDPALLLVMQGQAQQLTELLGQRSTQEDLNDLNELSLARRQQQLLNQQIMQLEQQQQQQEVGRVSGELNALLSRISELQGVKAVYDTNVQVNLTMMFQDATMLRNKIVGLASRDSEEVLQRLHKLEDDWKGCTGQVQDMPVVDTLEKILMLRNSLTGKHRPTSEDQGTRFDELMGALGWPVDQFEQPGQQRGTE